STVRPRPPLPRCADPRGLLQGPRPAHGALRAGALGLRLAVRGRQRLRAPRDLGRSHRRVHQGDGARAPGHRVILRAVVGVIYAFLMLPMVVVVLAAFNAGNYFTFPPQGLSLKLFANFFHPRPLIESICPSSELP